MRTGNVIVMRTSDIMFVSLLIHGYSDVLAILNMIISLLIFCSPPQAKIFRNYSLLNVFP